MPCSEKAGWCSPLPLQILGGNLVLEDLEVALALGLVQLSQPQALIQLQRLTAQRHNLVHLHTPSLQLEAWMDPPKLGALWLQRLTACT